MSPTFYLHSTIQRWLRDCALTPYVAGYFDHLIECGYSAQSTKNYIASIAHLGRWMSQCHLTIDQLDEQVIERLLDEHLPLCDCPRPVFRTRRDLAAACMHLLRLLRDRGASTNLIGTTVAAQGWA